VIVVIKMARWPLPGRQAFQFCAVHDEDVGPAVVVIIENRDAGAGCFDDVFFGVLSAKNNRCGEPSFLRDVTEMNNRL